MIILNRFHFFKNDKIAKESEIFYNNNYGSQLILEVSGNFTSCSISVLGIVNNENENNWTKLAIIDMSSFSNLDNINKKGIYVVGTDGINKIKLSLQSINGEDISVFGKLGY